MKDITLMTKSFMLKHNFLVNLDIATLVDSFLYDMECALHKEDSSDYMKNGMEMIPTWCVPLAESCRNKRSIVIDAGGTNFRCALVEFDSAGKVNISRIQKTAMPGVDRMLYRDEFFAEIANRLEYLKDAAMQIGFCFSYGMRITPDHDGIAMELSKEVKAPTVQGAKIGQCLKETLEKRGWKNIQRVSMLNDTQAALLSGAVEPQKEYSSYLGFILGTGINVAYIQEPIVNLGNFSQKQIIVTEAGKFDKLIRSDFDKALDATSINPGSYILEKMTAGGYLGELCRLVLFKAKDEGLFSPSATCALGMLKTFALKDASGFLDGTSSSLDRLFENLYDADLTRTLLDLVLDRAARHSAAMISSAVLKCGQGKDAAHPVCVLCNGSTFYLAYKMKERITGYLTQFLTQERGIYFDIVQKPYDIFLGAAMM